MKAQDPKATASENVPVGQEILEEEEVIGRENSAKAFPHRMLPGKENIVAGNRGKAA